MTKFDSNILSYFIHTFVIKNIYLKYFFEPKQWNFIIFEDHKIWIFVGKRNQYFYKH
jgi:hypothetical protein